MDVILVIKLINDRYNDVMIVLVTFVTVKGGK